MRVLIIDDDLDMCNLLTRFLQRKGFETDSANSGNRGISKFKDAPFDIVLCDFRLGDKEGSEVLKELIAISPRVIVIIITGYSDIKTAVDVIKSGAFDYITKPLIPDEVLAVINKALANQSKTVHRPEAPNNLARPKQGREINQQDSIVGQSAITRELYRQVALVAPTNYSIILYGESGTGKEVIARTIHASSERRDKPFIAMDCGTISKELAGSELFGHMKGSFTGAVNDKEGHFEMANGGTLFLDEVANLSSETQAALLRVIQERKIKRVGGNKEIIVDVRIIVASNENLQESYRKGKFREDLFHRFNEFSISLPALRNRRDDIPVFADYFLAKANEELSKQVEGFEPEVMQAFLRYAWPGNLREFRNVVRRSALLTSAGKIAMKVLPDEIVSYHDNIPAPALSEIPEAAPETRNLGLKDAAAHAEYEAIMKVLKQVNFNKSKAADILKIDRKTLYNKIKNYESES